MPDDDWEGLQRAGQEFINRWSWKNIQALQRKVRKALNVHDQAVKNVNSSSDADQGREERAKANDLLVQALYTQNEAALFTGVLEGGTDGRTTLHQ